MFLSAVILPVAFGLAMVADSPGPLLIPLTVFLAGLFWALYCRLFADDKPATITSLPAQQYRPNEYLPPPPVNAPHVLRAQQPNTAEIIQQPSVTEYTTNLLDKRKKS